MELVRIDGQKKLGLLVLCLFGLLVLAGNVEAAPALERTFQATQPSGETFTATQHGDEFFNYVKTSSGDIVEKGKNGYWYYTEAKKTTYRGAPATDLTATKKRYRIDAKPANAVQFSSLNKLENLDYTRPSPSLQSAQTSFFGKRKLLVLLVEFDGDNPNDARDPINPVTIRNTDLQWANLIFGTSQKSVRDYYLKATTLLSNPNQKIEFSSAAESSGTKDDGIVKVRLSGDHPNTARKTDEPNRTVVSRALTEANAFINYAQFDTNGNGFISTDELHVMVIVAGHEAAYSDAIYEDAIWAHWWVLPYTNLVLDGKNFSGHSYTQFGEMHDDHMATIGVIAHELGHDLGLPDLYDIGVGEDQPVKSRGLGPYSLMAHGPWNKEAGDAYAGQTPAYLDAYSKVKLGIVTPENVQSGNRDYTLESFDQLGYRVLKVPYTANPKEYLLIENRQFKDYDKGMETSVYSGGIAVYYVNEKYDDNIGIGKRLVSLKEACEEIIRTPQLDGVLPTSNKYDGLFYIGNGSKGKPQNVYMNPDRNTLPLPQMANQQMLPFYFECKSESSTRMIVGIRDTLAPVESISVLLNPSIMTYYVGDNFNPAGLALTVRYEALSLPSTTITSGYTWSPSKFDTPGNQTVTIFYGGKSITIQVKVIALQVDAVAVLSRPYKLNYIRGDHFDFSGLVLNVKYNSGANVSVSSGFSYQVFDNGIDSYVRVSYGGKTTSFSIAIYPKTGWFTENGKKIFYHNDKKITGLARVDNKLYYLKSDGSITVGWATISKKKYYFKSDGSATTGWTTISKKKYYFKSDCTLATGWTTIKKKKHYFRSNGTIKPGWITVSKKKYYLKSDASVTIGWKKISKKKYYFQKNGVMVKSRTMKIGKKRYRFNSKGVCQN